MNNLLALGKSGEGKIRIALILANDLNDVDNQTNLKQNDNRLRPNVRLKHVGVFSHLDRDRRFQHMREERKAKEDDEQNVDNQLKHSATTPFD